MIQSPLTANCGGLACRIIRRACATGTRTVAIFSDADAKAPHMRQVDEAAHIGPAHQATIPDWPAIELYPI